MQAMSEISIPTSKPDAADGKETTAQTGPSLLSSSLRKGGGAIRGIGEKFAASSVTGTGSMTVPIYAGPVRSGFGPQPMLCAFAVAFVAVGGAVVATLELGSAVKHTPTLFFCSVILSTWVGGVWPGIFAGLLSAIALDYYFIPPIYALGISLEEAPDMVAFVASALFVSWLSGEQKRPTAAVLFKGKVARDSLPLPPTLGPGAESAFFRHGDYWTIQYQGQIAHLKATRGLHCLVSLLEQPGREFHVSELTDAFLEVPIAVASGVVSGGSQEGGGGVRSARFQDAGPILDLRAKAEYRRRLAELREELEEAQRFNDRERSTRAQKEMDSIADQLAAAVGLGGRNRRATSRAERGRSAVTKRIKNSINKITAIMPALGGHLATSVKTGYFCSYNPNPDRPVKWKLEF
jgi:Domain of unknown function (DUF4118)